MKIYTMIITASWIEENVEDSIALKGLTIEQVSLITEIVTAKHYDVVILKEE